MLENRRVGIIEVAEALSISYRSTKHIVVHVFFIHELIEAIKRNSLKELKIIPAEAYKKFMKNGISRLHALLAQKEPILKAIIKICIKIHKNVVFLNQSGSNLIRCYTRLPLILPLGYFAPCHLLILRLRRIGYPLHEPSKCKRFSNFLQIINKKQEFRRKYDGVRSSGNKGEFKI